MLSNISADHTIQSLTSGGVTHHVRTPHLCSTSIQSPLHSTTSCSVTPHLCFTSPFFYSEQCYPSSTALPHFSRAPHLCSTSPFFFSEQCYPSSTALPHFSGAPHLCSTSPFIFSTTLPFFLHSTTSCFRTLYLCSTLPFFSLLNSAIPDPQHYLTFPEHHISALQHHFFSPQHCHSSFTALAHCSRTPYLCFILPFLLF